MSALTPGFADPTRDAQHAFRAVLDAMAHPGRSYLLPWPLSSPIGLGDGLAAVALTVLDEDVSVWLSTEDEATSAYLGFHTGVQQITDAGRAAFVVATPQTLPPLAELAQGTHESPHESATVVLDVRGCSGSSRFRGQGPGIDGSIAFDAPWAAADFLSEWQHNTERFPRGVDLLLVDGNSVSALPRTTRLELEV